MGLGGMYLVWDVDDCVTECTHMLGLEGCVDGLKTRCPCGRIW